VHVNVDLEDGPVALDMTRWALQVMARTEPAADRRGPLLCRHLDYIGSVSRPGRVSAPLAGRPPDAGQVPPTTSGSRLAGQATRTRSSKAGAIWSPINRLHRCPIRDRYRRRLAQHARVFIWRPLRSVLRAAGIIFGIRAGFFLYAVFSLPARTN